MISLEVFLSGYQNEVTFCSHSQMGKAGGVEMCWGRSPFSPKACSHTS